MSLGDKFHSELLDENILQDVLGELSSRTRPSKHLAEDNKTNVAISTTEAKTPKWTIPKPSSSLYTTPNARNILKLPPTTARTSYTSTPPATTGRRPPLSSGISRLPFHTTVRSAPRRQSYDAPCSTHSNTLPPLAPSIHTTSTTQPSSPALAATQRKQIILLTSDDHRSLRVFTHLSSFCATPTAQQSLRNWQTTYARKTGKEILLPPGESLRENASPKDVRGRWAGVGRRSLSRGRRDVSVGSSNGTGGGGLVGRGLRLFSGGRKSQIAVKVERSEFGGGDSEVGGGGKAWTVGEDGEGGGKVWIKRKEEAEGEGGMEGVRRLRPRRIY
jgi:hypothetical protein